MSDDGRGSIKFATSENTFKFYWANRGEIKLDYPSVFIGTMTPSTFKWSKMRHLYDIMDAAWENNMDPVIKCGKDEFTAIEFMQEISDSKMWIFDVGL